MDAPLPSLTRRFSSSGSTYRRRRLSHWSALEAGVGPALTTLFIGISAMKIEGTSTASVGLAIRDTVYLVDYSIKEIELSSDPNSDAIANYVMDEVRRYEKEHFSKFIGAGFPACLDPLSPTLARRLWLGIDVIPIVEEPRETDPKHAFWDVKNIDEQADSMARKCIMYFGPSLVPLLHVGWRGLVQTDAGFRARLLDKASYETTCAPSTWNATMHYADKLREKKIKIAFFSSTPQGGGVALMRHALVRFARAIDVDLAWYVPKPKPGVFRITKDIHNILQGVSAPDERISKEEQDMVMDWILDNANRYWVSPGGPLRPPSEGGADVVIIDDPQMPCLIPLAKEVAPNRPVLYRSHIQIRSDLIKVEGSPQAEIWNFLWDNIKHADMFISHPIPKFVPYTVPRKKVAYLPATTDWLDGLNKPLNMWNTRYYCHIYNLACQAQKMAKLEWPARQYIIQVARFDPSKGIPTVIESYAKFRRLCSDQGITEVPQLLVCGNGSVDDPNASLIFDQTMAQIEFKHPEIFPDCSIMRLEPNDQVLNALVANARVVLQLSTREGFEVKVSEALHTGRPVIATLAGGIPLQVKDQVNGFLVEPGDSDAVAKHLLDLFTDDELHARMSEAARTGVSDEVGTVGNALSWFYLAAKWTEVGVEPGLPGKERWVNDMARMEALEPYGVDENRLPRHFTQQ